MRLAIRQTLILWFSLLALGGLTFLLVWLPAVRVWLWQQTGEEALFSQVKGLTDLASDLLRPRLNLATATRIQPAETNRPELRAAA